MMKVALINPRWRFDGSIYFGCHDPHLPLELGYAKALLDEDGQETLLVDGHLEDLAPETIAERVADFAPDVAVITTAPTYLFWRCAQPELTQPAAIASALRPLMPTLVAIGPHGSTTPASTLQKLDVDMVLMGEAEELVRELARRGGVPLDRSIAFRDGAEITLRGGPHAGRFVDLPPLDWPAEWVTRHRHHHHRFDAEPDGPGAEVEASRGCPYSCSFCAKMDFRDKYRRRRLDLLLAEIDGLIEKGATYLYFVDEIFLPQRPLLEALAERPVRFGVQTRIDLWKEDLLELLGAAGCVSIEAGVESITEAGRQALDKNCRMSTEDLAARLIIAKRHVPFVQANLIQSAADDQRELVHWRERLRDQGVWANDPVPLFAYPGSPEFRRRFGRPDDRAWERAHEDYLIAFAAFSDIQDEQPLPLHELERSLNGGRTPS